MVAIKEEEVITVPAAAAADVLMNLRLLNMINGLKKINEDHGSVNAKYDFPANRHMKLPFG